MSESTRLKYLRIALVLVGIIFFRPLLADDRVAVGLAVGLDMAHRPL